MVQPRYFGEHYLAVVSIWSLLEGPNFITWSSSFCQFFGPLRRDQNFRTPPSSGKLVHKIFWYEVTYCTWIRTSQQPVVRSRKAWHGRPRAKSASRSTLGVVVVGCWRTADDRIWSSDVENIFFYGNFFGPSSRDQYISYFFGNEADQLTWLSCYCAAPRGPDWPNGRSVQSAEALSSMPMCGTWLWRWTNTPKSQLQKNRFGPFFGPSWELDYGYTIKQKLSSVQS